MEQHAITYYKKLNTVIGSIEVTSSQDEKINFYLGIADCANLIISQSKHKNKIMFIGNGASQSISSHLSTDFLKNGGFRTLAFTDPSLLTTISNDLGYEHVFAKPVEIHADEGDILIAISSSGQSKNILNACYAASQKKCHIISLSGFKPDNPLRSLGNINFFVPEFNYGLVEIIHHSICHCMLDVILTQNGNN